MPLAPRKHAPFSSLPARNCPHQDRRIADHIANFLLFLRSGSEADLHLCFLPGLQ